MRIALINENSQAGKNEVIFDSLKKVCDEKGYELLNFGMYGTENENSITYVQIGLLASILINTKTVDFVVTGCGTGQGAQLACNAFPGVYCGLVIDPTDAYLFSQINAGNAISIPFAKGFGWGAEVTLDYIFEKLFSSEFGLGYPRDRVIPEQRNKKILESVKAQTTKSLIEIIPNLESDFVRTTMNGENVVKYIETYAEESELKNYILAL